MAIVLWAGEGADCVDNAFRRIDDAFGAEQVVRLRGGQVVLELDNFGFEANGVGGVVWPAGVVLAHHLAGGEGGADCRRVVELGCGCAALGGLALAGSGRCDAVVTDLAEVVDLCARNVERNRAVWEGAGRSVTCVPLDWADEQLPVEVRGCDLVVGADLLWRSEGHEPLLRTLRGLCAQDDGPRKAIFTFQERHPHEERAFLEEIAPSRGFAVQHLPLGALPVDDWHKAHVKLIELTFIGQ